MTKKVLVPVADGSEEIEAVCLIDVLRRAGAKVTAASVSGPEVTCSRGVRLRADKLISEVVEEKYDLIALPGGMPGAENLRDSKELTLMIKWQASQGRLLAAICASPAVVLAFHGLLNGRRATGYPAFMDALSGGRPVEDRVAVDGSLITSRGPGTAIELGLKLVELLYGPQKAAEVGQPMLAAGY